MEGKGLRRKREGTEPIDYFHNVTRVNPRGKLGDGTDHRGVHSRVEASSRRVQRNDGLLSPPCTAMLSEVFMVMVMV